MVLKALKWVSYEDKKWDLMNLLDDNTYKIVDINTIENYLPTDIGNYLKNNDFSDKHLAVKCYDGESSATMAFFNINRIDKEKGEYVINQDQWFLAWHSGMSEPSPSGALFSHGEWDDRTLPIQGLPKTWIRNVLDSGLNEYIPVDTLPIKPSGNIGELHGTSHWHAYEALRHWL